MNTSVTTALTQPNRCWERGIQIREPRGIELRSTPSHERRRVRVKTMGPPINPDFDSSAVHVYIVYWGDTFFTSVLVNHLFRFEAKYPQYRSLERIPLLTVVTVGTLTVSTRTKWYVTSRFAWL